MISIFLCRKQVRQKAVGIESLLEKHSYFSRKEEEENLDSGTFIMKEAETQPSYRFLNSKTRL